MVSSRFCRRRVTGRETILRILHFTFRFPERDRLERIQLIFLSSTTPRKKQLRIQLSSMIMTKSPPPPSAQIRARSIDSFVLRRLQKAASAKWARHETFPETAGEVSQPDTATSKPARRKIKKSQSVSSTLQQERLRRRSRDQERGVPNYDWTQHLSLKTTATSTKSSSKDFDTKTSLIPESHTQMLNAPKPQRRLSSVATKAA